MPGFGRSMGGGRRSSPRAAVPMMAVLMTLTKTRTAVIADISCTGIRLSGPELPRKGEVLEMNIDRLGAFGIVVWSERKECGVAFDTPLAKMDVEQLRRRTRKVSLSNMSVDERTALDEWLLGVSR